MYSLLVAALTTRNSPGAYCSSTILTFDYEKLKDHPLIDATTIGLKGSPTNILTSFTPPQKGAGQMLEGNDMKTCEKLAGILSEKHII